MCIQSWLPAPLWAAFTYLGILSLATGKVCVNKLHDRVINYRESRANLGSRSQLLQRWELWQTHEERSKGRLIFKRKAEVLLVDFVPLKWDHFWPWFLWEQAQSPNFCLMFFYLSLLSWKGWCFKTTRNSSFFIEKPNSKPWSATDFEAGQGNLTKAYILSMPISKSMDCSYIPKFVWQPSQDVGLNILSTSSVHHKF